MKTRRIGHLNVSAVGMGCMGFSHGYGAIPERDVSVSLIQKAYEQGCNFFDTAEGYAQGHNENLVGEALKPIRDNVILATKFIITDEEASSNRSVLHNVKKHLEASLKRLATDRVDLYYQHRANKGVPTEELADAMGELIKEGKILGWGLSQSTEDEIRCAHAVTPLTAIQNEYSMMERMFERDVIPACKELGIGFVPFSPLASGFLSGKISTKNDYQGDDVRRVISRFNKENIKSNQPLLDLLYKFASEKEATPAQISLAWMLYREDFIVPIPGMRSLERIKENLGAADVTLTSAEFNQIESALAKIEIYGNRTDEDISTLYR